MVSFFSHRENCYCAFCKTPRRIYRKKNISFMNVVASIIAAVVFMFALWQEYDPRVIFVAVFFTGVSEVFIKVRWRLSVVCRQCGFDPVLYLKQPDLVAAKVKAHLDVRREDPKYMLAKPIHLPAITEKKAQALQAKEKGRLVSRSV